MLMAETDSNNMIPRNTRSSSDTLLGEDAFIKYAIPPGIKNISEVNNPIHPQPSKRTNIKARMIILILSNIADSFSSIL